MGSAWRTEPGEESTAELGRFGNPNPRSDGERCATRKVVKSQCRTEEVEPGKFLRKCERTEEILRDCIGRPVEVVQSNREYTEEDVTDQVLKGSFRSGSPEHDTSLDFPGLRSDIEAIEKSFDFPGLRGDIDEIERSFFSGISRFFEAAEDMKNGIFGVFSDPHIFDGESSSSKSQGVPLESNPQEEAFRKRNKPESGHVDLSGLARDV